MAEAMLPESPTEEDVSLARALTPLTHPVRLTILRQLREPRILKSIRVTLPVEEDTGDEARHPPLLARQTVKAHLDQLLDVGVVTTVDADAGPGNSIGYVVNNQTLFALGETFRRLARLRPETEPDADTLDGLTPAPEHQIAGPSLVLVSGLEVGRLFPLVPTGEGEATWRIGRRRDADVALDFDPFVSADNALVAFEDDAYHVEALPGTRNGTSLNFQLLKEGQRRRLATGDLIGVGRCLLMFRA